jgi:hypothetical protein
MKRMLIPVLGLALVIGFSAVALAHEGHSHADGKVMGTVTMIHTADVITHIEVKTSAGEVVVLTADANTKIIKGKAAASLGDVKTGLRVVATVTKDGQTNKVTELQIGGTDASAAHAEHKDDQHHHDDAPHNQ